MNKFKLYVLPILLGLTTSVIADVELTFNDDGINIQHITCERIYTTCDQDIEYGYNCILTRNEIIGDTENVITGNVLFNMFYNKTKVLSAHLNEFDGY